MTIYTVTLKTPATHDAEKRADLNSFLKTMKRTFGLKCVGIEEKQADEQRDEPPRKSARAKKLPGKLSNEPQTITEIITNPKPHNGTTFKRQQSP